MRSLSIVGRVVAAALLALTCASSGCKKGSSSHPDGGDATLGDTKPNSDTQLGDRGDVGQGDVPPVCDTRGTPKAMGEACACNAQCTSGFCVDGVCCTSACTEGCKTCNAPDSVGTCVMRAVGTDPRDANTCATTAASTCGTDGKCDGAGGCRKYPQNTLCKAGTCDGDAVVGSSVCDGNGHCKLGSTRICVPFSCDPNTGACATSCTSNSQCSGGTPCVQGSCGKRTNGMPCDKADDCASNFCADKVCCNVACQGPCLSCNLTGREGRCWPLDADKPDTRGICHDQGPTSCGQTGFCDGIGGCSKYPRDTQCMAPTCSGNANVNTAGTCNGSGSCLAGGIQQCHPFRCASGACTTICNSAADCDTGIACVNNTCGPKQDGQTCTASSECQHNHCVDGVCCDQACTGACRSCSLSASLGRCTPIAAGTADPRAMCAAMPQSTCKTNGKCDGNGGCQSWPVGTLCADESCTSNVYKAPSTCNASGQCVAPDLIPCSPYVCNGTARCFNACTNSTQCLTPNTCAANSCGLKELGAMCSGATECKSGFCAQGVCCDQACNSACKSCVAGMQGICSNVATGTIDPAGICQAQDPSTCGTNGKCEAGACQRWASGTVCKAATCPSTTNQFTAISTCDGSGACVTPASTGCFPFTCATDRCNPSCTTDAQCQLPAVCVNGSCGLKPDGAACGSAAECLHNFCEQGVCCQTACQGTCKSCALSTSRGVCSNIPASSADPLSRCADQGATSCGTDGKCDGKGACRLYDATTACAAPSCPSGQSTAISGRTCNGLGVCQPASSTPCAPYVCNGSTACLSACTRDADCLPPTICDPQTNRCGNLLRAGQACTATSMCLTGLTCLNGVCCVSSSCPLCQACNVGASAGSCANLPVGTADPLNRCTANPPCGNTGLCNGAGGCQLAATTVSCGTQTCMAATLTPVSHCSGTGNCAAATSSSCSPYVCGTSACKTAPCAADADCLSPFTCQGTGTNKNCALKVNGTACTAGNQCISGNCVNGVCCGTSTCGTCQACNLNGMGTCSPMAAGAAAPSGQCAASPPCGNTGACNGASGCQQGSTSTACGSPVSCNGTTYQPASFCSGSGTCTQAPTSGCGNYICGVNACLTSCTADAQCASTSLYCTGNTTTAGTCDAKKANGAACGAAKECTSGNCTDGVCCTTASCGTCQSCSVSGNGTCGNVANNTADPQGRCPASTGCGNTGFCVNGACEQQPSSKSCGTAASCTGSTRQPPSFCSGTGTCNQTSTMDCGPYLCGTNNACKTSCSGDGDCVSGSYCAGSACVTKKALGSACGLDNECISANCIDGVCCSTNGCPTCQACNLNGAGTCANVGTSTPTIEPHFRCSNTASCKDTSLCVNGACQQQPSTTACGPSVSCTGSTYQPQSFCNGSGSCNTMSPTGCGNYVCNGAGTACLTSCNYSLNMDGECTGGSYCTEGGSCQPKKSPGNSCTLGHECTTGNCVDGICCTSPSCGTCQSCGSGSCAAVTNGTAEPHNLCPANPPCGNTGTCTNGTCTQAAAGTQCVGYFCASATQFQPAATCNGLGSCSIPSVQDCSPYMCGVGSCAQGCTDDSQCAAGTWCNGGSCVAAQTGVATCSRDRQCGTGHCTEGYCCQASACPFCQSCAVAPTQGTCTALPAHTPDVTGTCQNQGAASCGTNGLCNGGGNCEHYDMSTLCGTSCVSPLFTRLYCDGLGGCNQPQVEACVSLACDANGCTP